MPIELCIEKPMLDNFGFFRRLNDDQCDDNPPCFEFLSVCSESANSWLSIHESDFNKLMDKYVDKSKESKKTK